MGNKEPIEFLLLKGNGHFTKEEIEKRKAEEIKVKDKEILTPEELPPDAKKIFEQKYHELKEYGLITYLETELLTRYASLLDKYKKSEKEMKKKEYSTGTDLFYKMVRLQSNMRADLLTMEKELCLTLPSRLKIPAKKKEEKEADNFERAFK